MAAIPPQFGFVPPPFAGFPQPQVPPPMPHQTFQMPQPAAAVNTPSQNSTYLLPMQVVEEIIQQLRAAMKGLGTDEKAIAAAFSRCLAPEQTEQVISTYKARFGKDLREALKSETSGNFGKLCEAIATPIGQLEAELIHKAVSGAGTDEKVLCEVLVGRSNAEVHAVRAWYRHLYNKELEQVLKEDFSGHLKKFYVALVQGARDEAGQVSDVEADVHALYKAGEGKIGTDETAFIGILLGRSEHHLRRVFEAYAAKHGRTIEKVVQKEFSGDLEQAVLALVLGIKSRGEYIATCMEKDAMAGLGTDDSRLIRLVVLHRHPEVMHAIKGAFLAKYGVSLAKRIKGETSGNYKDLLLSLIGESA